MAFIDLPTTLQVEPWKMKDLCYKLADTSSRSIKKPIWLRPGEQGCTDGRIVQAPLTDPEGYLVTGHEIAHIAFGSRPEVATAFARQLAKDLVRDYMSRGSTLLKGNEAQIEDLIFAVSNILDDHRVTQWWGRAYPGDKMYLEARWRRMMQEPQRQQMAKTDLLQFLLAAMTDSCPPDADPDFLYVQDVIEQAYVDVRSVDFPQCLALTKQLFEKLVRIFAKKMQARQPPPPAPQPSQGQQDQGEGQSDVAPADGKGEGDDKGEAKEDRKEKADQGAFQLLLLAGQVDKSKMRGTDFDDLKPSDWHRKQLDRGRISGDIQAQVDAALNSTLSDEELDEAEAAMDFVVRTLRGETSKESKDEFLKANAYSKVVFNDVPRDKLHPVELSDGETRSIRRTRAKFVQIQGKTRRTLEDFGTTIDIGQAIQRRFVKAGPIFKSDVKAPGFEYLLLGDGSGSVIGPIFSAIRRASTILNKSLNFPSVKGKLWIYQGEGKECKISRVPKPELGLPLDSDRDVVGGYTPTHTAVRVAVKEMRLAKGVRRIFLITDGEPNGHPKADFLVRKNILEGRRYGIHTYTLYIGGGVRSSLARMAGGKKFLTQCDPEDVEVALTQLVELQFQHYLQEKS